MTKKKPKPKLKKKTNKKLRPIHEILEGLTTLNTYQSTLLRELAKRFKNE